MSVPSADRHVETTRRCLQIMCQWYGPRDFTVRFWGIEDWLPDPGQPSRFTWVLNHPGAFRAANIPPSSATCGGAYLYDDFDIEGDIIAFVRLGNYFHRVAARRLKWYQHLAIGWRLLTLPNTPRPRLGHNATELSGSVHSRERDLQAISYHYNFSNRVYELMLGPTMGYTSGVFAHENEDLDAAQTRKFDLICRKLRLAPGQRMLDVGCGWGGLMIHAAKNYGVDVVGVTISEEQAKYCREKIDAAGVAARCEVRLCDYRDIEPTERFDKITTVEVAEHFGVAQFPTYFRKCFALLKPRGNLLLQQITLLGDEDPTAAKAFCQAYVFPDGELASLDTSLRAGAQAGFEPRDVESFREHYMLTLKHWLENTEARREELIAECGEAGYRKYRIFYAGAYYGFDDLAYNVHQMLFAKPDDEVRCGLPLNRTDWYHGIVSR